MTMTDYQAQADANARAKTEQTKEYIKFGIKITLLILAAIIVIIWGWKLATPAYNLHAAETEKRIKVEDARAERDSAVLLAEGEVNRARGIAEANDIIAGSLTPEYLQYEFIRNFANNKEQIIYVPTEAGIPILEAGRAVDPDAPANVDQGE